MSTTMVASEAKAVPPVVLSIQDIPLEKICESKTNPRSQFDQVKLAELADFVPRNKTGVMRPTPLCGAPGLSPLRWVTGGYARLSFYPTPLFARNHRWWSVPPRSCQRGAVERKAVAELVAPFQEVTE
jgi:hypothetical protein